MLALAPEAVDEFAKAVAGRVAAMVGEQLEALGGSSPWLSVAEAAEYLRCKPKRIYYLVSQHRIPTHRDGSRLLFRRDELDAYVLADDAGAPLTPVQDRPPRLGISSAARTNDPQVRGPEAA